MQITRKAKHEAAIQAYGKKVAAMEVTLETRTGHAGRGFKKLLTLNDEEIQAIFDEMADEFLLEMELVDVSEMWDRLHEQTTRREGWITDFEADLQGVEAERRAMIELELGKLLDSSSRRRTSCRPRSSGWPSCRSSRSTSSSSPTARCTRS